MKFLALCLLTLLGLPAVATETLNIDPEHSAVIFSWNHFGYSNPLARLEKIDGVLELDKSDLSKSRVSIQLALDGLRTGSEALDKRLKTAEFLDAGRYPEMRFTST